MTHAPADVAHRPDGAARLRADLALLAVSAVWGATFVMVKEALASTGPLAFLALRFAFAAALMEPFLRPRRGGGLPVGRSTARAGAALGVALFAGYAFQTVGLQFTTPARAAFITGISVVLVPLLSAFGLRRAVVRGVWAGVALAAVGLALLSLGPDLLRGGPLLSAATALGDLIVFGCAVAFAVQIVLVGEFAPRHDVAALTAYQLLVAAALAIGFTVLFERPTPAGLWANLPAAAFTGAVATVLAFVIQARAQRFTTPTRTALVFSTEPVFGALAAFLLVGEVLAPLALLGCALILAGMVVAQLAE